MQVLLILILTYNIYFGSIFYEILKFSTVKAFAVKTPKNYTTVLLDDFDNTSKSNEKSYLDIYWRSRHGCIQRFTTNKFAQVKTKDLKLLRYCKNARRVPCSYFHTKTNRLQQRKLLGYERNFCERPTKYHKSDRISMHRDIIGTTRTVLNDVKRRRKHDIAEKISKLNDENTISETWDNWNNWSACSVTCGKGQQVRWRHCLSENCIKGLKKAQLKSCYLKDCSAKGFLGWLGIKPSSV